MIVSGEKTVAPAPAVVPALAVAVPVRGLSVVVVPSTSWRRLSSSIVLISSTIILYGSTIASIGNSVDPRLITRIIVVVVVVVVVVGALLLLSSC